MQIKYNNYISHYIKDAEFFNYFETSPFERQNIRRRYEQLFSLIPNNKQRVLEIGSGGGFALKEIEKKSYTYFPLDIPLSNLKEIKKLATRTIFPMSGDAFQLPIKEESFNTVILSEVLEHLDNPDAALQEMKRVLANDGILLISVPNKERISYQICVHCNKPTPTNAHFHSFDEKNLKLLIEKNGLMVNNIIKISNKIATRLYIYRIVQGVNFTIWKVMDQILNFIFPKPSHLIMQVKKKNM